MSVQIQLSEKNLDDIMQHSTSRISLSELNARLAQDEIIMQNVLVERPVGAGVPITVVRDIVDRYLELIRNPGPIDGQWQPQEYAIVQY
ncbi:hypothetical protein pEaSNUABM14_00251 [Erwinia phage pEa_SNUABM_14]|uniref:Uncharacterized protein n=1 Tax=Erwinia phage pEa_SNUABM_7 TaxID=2866695 RepID=A0AAE7WSP0_9CAUD|nr:hypothetical protein MPK74_gp252 [Erwinia phage pEa_SNUABM_7]QYW03211.1 hypothetical protein pEaSNUABM13_00252 [Erwinia phage pEa_SNUABM_13]QYW03894.1 hypothetical protein pEaSNUABM45_00251 [Erwinia phage pEa_SNUABM_45]QYW04235.1 hypothetical protein pEaSNUABM46_00251 [Erwinia phage pEa_SNUABM_46]QYW04576.1 hypothetical protein pEaSNUABM14_00251 [Erwinia phage pEa_SNUABM_14]QYW05264.1 hypothetical protein pEaSNUABM21_00250 [Erwinia phage pEa_SNUABM_21]QYW05606.1 hypothetical protein pEaSNU